MRGFLKSGNVVSVQMCEFLKSDNSSELCKCYISK